MAITFSKIASVAVASGGASTIDFTSIPSSFTDLQILVSSRGTNAANDAPLFLTFNGSTSSYSHIYVLGTGSTADSGTDAYGVGGTKIYAGTIDGANNTSNTFANTSIYVSNYAGSSSKSLSIDSVEEGNSVQQYAVLVGALWSNSSSINRVTLTTSSNFAQHTTAVLYGIKKP